MLPPHQSKGPETRPVSFTRKALRVTGIVLGAILFIYLFANAFEVFLLIFAGILIAVFFRGSSYALSQRTGLPDGWALAIVVIIVLAATTVTIMLLAPRISEQVAILREELPVAVSKLRDDVEQYRWGKKLMEEIPSVESVMQHKETWLRRSMGVLSTTLGVLANLYVILFIAIFLTAQPHIYKQGIVMLFPLVRRDRITEVLETLGATLYKWLLGKFFSMLVVTVFTVAGLYFLNIPMALSLGVIAGLLSFIPNFGPLLGLIPATLVALLLGPDKVLYVILLFIAIQTVESNIITPLVQKKMIRIPPVLIIVGQLVLSVFSGTLGLILATPLMAVAMVLVKMLYVHDTLGDKNVKV